MGLLAIAVAAATTGALLGYYLSGERSGATATTGRRTVTATETVTETVVRRIARPDRRAGKRVFVTVCSKCHALEPGDWRGERINLTDLRPSYGTIVEKVAGGGTVMPSFAGKLSKREIRDVAAFVAAEVARRARKTR